MNKENIIKSSSTSVKKASKRLKDITFDHEGAHLALCGAEQGAANNKNTALILKAKDVSQELILKAQSVQVTMELPDFLSKFFYLWEEDAKVLAYMMGYVEPPETVATEKDEATKQFQDWVESRFTSLEIMKSLHTADSLSGRMQELTEEQLHLLFDDQLKIVKSLKEFDIQKSDTSSNTEVSKKEVSASKIMNKGKHMNKEAPEMVAKSELEEIQKSFDNQQVELQKAKEEILKAQELIKAFQEEKKQAIIKAKTDTVQAVLQDEKSTTVIMKALAGLESKEDFEAVVTVLKGLKEQVEKSAMFKEIGATVTPEEDVKKNGVLEIIKAQNAKK